MNLTTYLDGMRAARTAAELKAAIQAARENGFKHPYHGRVWSRICKVRKERGRAIVATHQHARFIPVIGERRRLTVCGETYGVGYGQNSTGERYVWTYAQEWAENVLRKNGFGLHAAHRIWESATDGYPHRAIGVVEEALAGKLPDPPFNRLIFSRLTCDRTPVTVDRDYEEKHRAHRPCGCGGTRWDWGCGWVGYAYIVNWYCDGCPRIYHEYVSNEGLTKIRQSPRALREKTG